MDTTKILLEMLWLNKSYIWPIILLFILISFSGAVYWLSFIKEKSLMVTLAVAPTVGIFVYIIFLSLLSYFFKGSHGIFLITVMFFASATLLALKNYKSFPKLEITYSISNAVIAVTFLLFTAYFLFQVGANIYGGDVIAYWGFATSFANGNYPVISPWQPDWLAIHHQGTFLVEGAIYSLTNADISLIHTLYAYVSLVSGFATIWIITHEITKRKFLSILPALVFLFSIGGIFVPLPEFLQNVIHPEVSHVTNRLPIFIDAKNRLGGASNLPDLIYINHRLISLIGMIVIFMAIVRNTHKRFRFYFPSIIAVLSMAVISSDEVYLPSIGFAVVCWFLISLFKDKKSRTETFMSFALAGIFFVLSFFLVGNSLRDSFLQPPFTGTRFTLLHDWISLSYRLREFRSVILKISENSSIIWLLPSVWVYICTSLFYYFKKPHKYTLILLFASFGAAIASLFAEHTFYPSNNGRFLHVIYPLLSFSILISILSTELKLFSFKSLLLLLFFVEVLFSSVFLIRKAKSEYYPNFAGRRPQYEVLHWTQQNLPNERVLFVDGYLKGVSYSYLSLVGTQNFGLIIPVGPAFYKIHTPDFGPEVLDAIVSLSPQAFHDLQTHYVFITKDYSEQFPEVRIRDLKNKDYFEPIYSDDLGTMYYVTNNFVENGVETENTFKHLYSLIPKHSVIFVDYAPPLDHYIRANATLLFKDNTKLVSHFGHGIFNYIETAIHMDEPSISDVYDYLVLSDKTRPQDVCNCDNVQVIWETYGAKAYKVIR